MNNEDFFKSTLHIQSLAKRRLNWFYNRQTKKAGDGYFVDKNNGTILVHKSGSIVSEIWYSQTDHRIIFERKAWSTGRTINLRQELKGGLSGKFSYFAFDNRYVSHVLYDSDGTELHSRRYRAKCFRTLNHEEYTILKDKDLLDAYQITYNDDGSTKKADGSLASILPLK